MRLKILLVDAGHVAGHPYDM